MTDKKNKDAADEEPSLLLKVEQIKYRKAGPGKSPVGTFWVYEDRIEWTNDSDPADQLLLYFSKIKGQRISPPNKPKVQLQVCMLKDDDQSTFVFVNSKYSQEQLLHERDLVKETLQQALVRYRQLMNQLAQKAAKGGSDKEQEDKIKILEQNAHLRDLYLHLVREKLISAQDFWSFYYKPEHKSTNNEKRIGISGGFLSSIVQYEGMGGGIRLNLTTETIQSIFRTYPAVERKHLELVPHEMSEQEFWQRFFQSHYFHRERNPAEPSTSAQQQLDPFVDCVKMDEKDMRDLIEKGKQNLKRQLDLTNIDEDLGILSEMRSIRIPLQGSSEAKRLLVRRCNYHSERVLSTMEIDKTDERIHGKHNKGQQQENGGTKINDSIFADSSRIPTTRQTDGGTAFDLELESQELAEIDKSQEEYCPLVAYNTSSKETYAPSSNKIQKARITVKNTLDSIGSVLEEKNQFAFFDNLATNFFDEDEECQKRNGTGNDNSNAAIRIANVNFKDISQTDIKRIRIVHSCLAELLRHFWHCFPPKSPEMEQKIYRMDETLKKYEEKQLADCEQRYGTIHVEHCKFMLSLARQRFIAFVQQQKR